MASVLELILRSRKEGDAAKKTEDELKRLEKASGGAAAAAKKLNLGMLAVQGAVITAGMSFLKSIPAIIDQGVEIDRAETALIAYSGSAEEAARTVELMKDAADGAMSRMDAMRNATRLLSMGLASSADEAAKMTEVAITLGSTMGKGPQAALEDFSLMLANQSIPRLDTFGIAGAKVREIMADLAAKGIAPTDRQTRFLIATMEVAEEKMGLLEDAGYDATSSVDRLKATIEDVKDAAITWLADGLMPIIDGVYALNDAIAEHDETMIYGLDTYAEYEAEYRRLHKVLDAFGVPLGMLNVGQWEAARAAGATTEAVGGLENALLGAAGAGDGLAEANMAIALSLSEVTQATLAKEAMDELNEAWKTGSIDADEYQTLFQEVGTNIAGLDQDSIDAQLALFNLNQKFSETDDVDGYVAAIRDLGLEIGALPDYKKIKIELLIERLEEEEGMFQRGGSFIVRGPPGPDRVPVRFMATAGERVTVTPVSQTTTTDNRQFFPGAQMNFDRPIDEEVLLEQIRRIAS